MDQKDHGTVKDYEILPALKEDWEPAMELCWRTFLKFEAPVYSQEGVKNFFKFINGEQIYEMFLNGEYRLWVAKSAGKIVGVGSLRAGIHISLLFVDEEYQRKGIGLALVRTMQQSLSGKNNIRLTVNSSPYGEKFYHSIGFIDADQKQEADGIVYTPMTLFRKL